MALSEVQGSGQTIRRTEEIGGSDTVKHVDELDEDALDAFLAGISGASVATGALDDVDVVVFTDYFRVESA